MVEYLSADALLFSVDLYFVNFFVILGLDFLIQLTFVYLAGKLECEEHLAFLNSGFDFEEYLIVLGFDEID